MKKWNLTHPEEMLFALLRASLHQKEVEISYFQNVTDDDWSSCFRIAKVQGVAALAWDGLKKLPTTFYPPLELKLKWGMAVRNCEKKHRRYCQTIHELSAFYASHDIATLQLKGVGFSSYYPVPEHREGGDIDIFTFSTDKAKMTDVEANGLADELMRKQGIDVDLTKTVKHSNYIYQGVPIENHKTFLNVDRFPIAVQVEKILHELIQPETVSFYDGVCRFHMPNGRFNTLFISFHAAQHYGSGLAIHHLCDWAMVLVRHGLHLPEELVDKHFLSAISAFTQLCNAHLGTSTPVRGCEILPKKMLTEILHPRYDKNIPAKTPIGIMLYKIKRTWYLLSLRHSVLRGSRWKILSPVIKRFLKNPSRLFQKNGLSDKRK